ncbi:uncharacterized protein CPUR_02993 [Claviceps purpurea 20.1]|uniref:Cyanovirin-N domain-containing protein n=1 Tax=Claviceps purpurea (strain 20.1) TaxID=1111077 RepID=M1W4H5_CLAP2|nr:hypothetical protein E4U50_005206 [Claviceps purpurea]KAG6289247.1 hypothetical protein E4U46_002675 [Claviceps purpurea]CCE29300.1 uncharacterized protein CPUR_02993 [Claviceps purpurea 20.1]
MKLFTSLPLALFACHALAQCIPGAFNGSEDQDGLEIRDQCSLGPHNRYTCRDEGKTVMTVVHKKDAFTFTAFAVDATVYINCDNGKNALFSCRVASSDTYFLPACENGVSSIYNVHQK